MAKKIKAVVKLQIPACSAGPSPAIGFALGQHGVNIGKFCQEFNERTKNLEPGMTIPVVVTIYEDKTFEFVLKTPPVSALLKKAAGIAKASGRTGHEYISKVTRKQVEEIAKMKLKDLNTQDLACAIRMVEGTARTMGIEIVE